MLLDIINVKSLQLHHRLHMALECEHFTKPGMNIKTTRFSKPRNFSMILLNEFRIEVLRL